MKVILLGTNGGPRVNPKRWAPSQVVLVDDEPYVVDCGDGVTRRLTEVGVDLRRIKNVFITHHHSDHNAGFGTLMILAWASGLDNPVDVWGPPPLGKITKAMLEEHDYDISMRINSTGRVTPLADYIQVHELAKDEILFEDKARQLTVRACLVEHPPVAHAFAYRFDTPTRSVVISGDTAPSQRLIEFATGADVLIHEVLYTPAIDTELLSVQNAPGLRGHLMRSHTPIEEVGKVAAAAKIKKLVLSHLVPGAASVTDEMWKSGIGDEFSGEVIVGRDLMEV